MTKLDYANTCYTLAKRSFDKVSIKNKCSTYMVVYYQNLYLAIRYALEHLLDYHGIKYGTSTTIRELVDLVPGSYYITRWHMYLSNYAQNVQLWWDAFHNSGSIDFKDKKNIGSWQTVKKMLERIENDTRNTPVV